MRFRHIFIFFLVITLPLISKATIFFDWDFESEACDSVIAHGSSYGSPTPRIIHWGAPDVYTGTERPTVRCALNSPDPAGNRYLETESQANRGVGAIDITWPSNLALINGGVYYFGYFHRIDRMGSGNPYVGRGTQVQGDMDSYDKSLDWGIQGTAGETRWVISAGYPNAVYQNSAYVPSAYSFDLWCPAGSNPILSCDSAQVFDSLSANVSPYSVTNIKGNSFEQWHAVVAEIKMGTGTSGYVRLYVDGVLTHNYQNITTAGSTTPHFNRFWVNSTLSQPAYNTTHRKNQVDRILFTDSLATVQAAGLMSDPESGSTPTPTPDTQAPTPPGSLSAAVISPTQVNLSWSAATDNVGVTGYRLERCTGMNCTTFTQISTPTGTSFNNTTLTAGTTYQYRVRAIDAAGNLSLYSTTVSATTPSAPTPTPAPPPGSTTITLAPTSDTYLDIDASNRSTDPILSTYTWPTNTVANTIVMKFNLGSIPSNATVSSAFLNLTYTGSDPGDTDPENTLYTVSAHKLLTHNPDLTRATGYTYDGVNFWTGGSASVSTLGLQDIGPSITSGGVTKAPGASYAWNLTSLVQDWIGNPALNYGLLLNSDPTKLADRSRYFASQEHGMVSSRPSLTVTYTVPSGGDATPPAVPGNVRVL